MSSPILSVWTDSYNIHWCDADTKGNASIMSLFNYMQESALRHAGHLGFGYDAVLEVKQIWVIVRMQLEVNRYPQWGESIMIRTWPRGVESIFALRDYEIIDSNGNVIVAATSRWIVIDAITRRPLPMKIIQQALYMCDPREAIATISEAKMPADDFVLLKQHTVQYCDLDKHNHVNNTRYVEWIVNAFPGNWFQGHEITAFRIDYQGESHQDDEIAIYADQPEGMNTWIKAIRTFDQKIIFKALISWR
ncbi:MAG TPA: acyl-ACP thioesterase domain-containing protein [Bacteroidales bacterium]